MSFMFSPLDFDDQTAVNFPALSDEIKRSIVFGTPKAADALADAIRQRAKETGKGCAVALDGYIGAEFDAFANLVLQRLSTAGIAVSRRHMGELYKPAEQINEMIAGCLPTENPLDPINLFGRVYEGEFSDFIDLPKAEAVLADMGGLPAGRVLLLTGCGSASQTFADAVDLVVYVDISPKTAAIRAREGKLLNIGDNSPRPFADLMRRNYYVDFEIVLASRKRLLEGNRIDYYIDGNLPDEFALMPGRSMEGILRAMADRPFRCKPVYMEGVWGGELIRKVRRLPAKYRNIAWVYEMIAFEVSLLIDVGGKLVEIPFSTMIQKYPKELMGEKSVQRFGAYFPIRFNYDDTFHGNGNMSIQVHPYESFNKSEHNERGSQDESYYVVAAGHGARTFIGFREDASPDEFFALVKQSEKTGQTVDYLKYINNVNSYPGRQVMLPGGTVHASGRNQLVLEIGSLTVGAYTYKMYDYNRIDLNGTLRPIHSAYAEKVIRKERNTSFVNANLAIEPRIEREGQGFCEKLIGSTDLMYFETRQIDLDTGAEIEMKNNGQFTVLTMVDGEEALVYSRSNPQLCFRQKYLEIVIVPATIDDFVIENVGYQPAVIHKTALK